MKPSTAMRVERPPLPLGPALWAVTRCATRTAVLLFHRCLHQPATHLGRRCSFADGTTAEVYRETVADVAPASSPAVLVVCFRLRHVRSARAHAVFRLESVLNTVLFAGFPGFVSKLWFANDENGVYRGLYDWDDPAMAEAYVARTVVGARARERPGIDPLCGAARPSPRRAARRSAPRRRRRARRGGRVVAHRIDGGRAAP